MHNTDFIQRFVFDDLDARGCMVRLEQTVEDIQNTHHYPPALGNLLNMFGLAAVLLRDSIKIDADVTLQLRTPGVLKLVMADCLSDRRLRAIAEYEADDLIANQSFNLNSLGEGSNLAITISPTEGDRYQSIVPIEHESLAECLEEYFSRSEQLPTWFSLHTDGKTAVGIAIHALPQEKESDKTISDEQFNRLKILLDSLSEEESLTLESEQILTRLFHDDQCRVFEKQHVEFGCDCSIQRSIEAIYSLGKEDVDNLVLEQKSEGKQSLIVDCHFCFQRYEFDFEDLGSLFD